MDIVEWAKNEAKYFEDEEYSKGCVNSALKAFISLTKDGHSGMSIGVTKTFLDRMIDMKPLSNLTGQPDEWEKISEDEVYCTFQNKRCSSVFKDIYHTGEVVFRDIDRVVCEDINNSNNTYYMGGVNAHNMWDRIFGRIKMPYYPGKSIRVFTDDFLFDSANGDFDHRAVLYALMPNGVRVEIDEYYREDKTLYTRWRRISKEEYMENKKNRIITHSDLQDAQKAVDKLDRAGDISDGYHTFDELYYHRMMLFSIICNTYKDKAWKSKLHADGTMYDDMFLVGITTPAGDYSYHYNLRDWDKFEVKELDNAPEWDGHKPEDIIRLRTLLNHAK